MVKCCLIFVTVKVKFNQVQAMKFQKGSKGIALLFLTLHDRRSMPHPGHFTPGERDPIPLCTGGYFCCSGNEKSENGTYSAISFVFLLVMS